MPCKIAPNLDGKVKMLGEPENALKKTGQGEFIIELKKGEEIVLYSGEKPDLTIKPIEFPATDINHWGMEKNIQGMAVIKPVYSDIEGK